MDLKYTDIDGIEQGELDGYSVDFSIGGSNDFAASGDGSCLSVGCRLYETGTECGGIIRDRSSDTSSGTVTYIGDTWRGMLAQKIVEPDAGQDYYSVEGNVTDVLNDLIVKCDLADMYTANTPVDLNVKHQFNRYESLLDGITTMLGKYGYKLSIRCDGATVELYASEIRDLSSSVEVSQDGNYSFIIEQRTPVNHLIALGQGELKYRTVVHLYIQKDGTIGSSKFYTGIDEITEVYENTNAETVEDLTLDARKRFDEIIAGSNSLELTVNEDVGAELGDIVGGRDYDTGIYIKAQIVEVIIKVEDGVESKSYTVGSATSATSTRSTSGGGSSTVIVNGEGSNIKVDDQLSSTSTNPVQNKVITSNIEQIEASIPTVDEALSATSTNAIQNKAVYEALKSNAYALNSHITDTVKHITSTERNNWDSAKNHADSVHARTDATKVEKSSTNGNIKINGNETTVYTHPSGTNPHGTTASDVGLGKVGNFKAVSTVSSQGLTDTEKTNARNNIGAGTSSLVLGETSSTAYRGDRGKTAYDHSQSAHAPSNAQANVIETVKVNGTAITPSSKAVDITVPTNNNQLTNGAGYITSSGTAKTISDTLPISKGGTGQTTGINAANALINSLSTGNSTPTDNDYYVSQYVNGGTTTTTYHRRPMSALWRYIKSKLATVATTGSYNDLSNKPTIPTVGNGTITITQNGTTKGTFTTNQSGNTTIALTDTDTNTTYGVATSSALGLVKSGTDITVDSSGNVSVNDDSHNHVISNVDGLQNALDGKAASSHTHTKSQISDFNKHLTSEDLNNIKTAGFYYAGGNNSVSNKPSGVDAFGLEVIQSASGWFTQIIYASNNVQKSYRRWFGNNKWTSWEEEKLTDTNTTYSVATTSSDGLMSADDKTRLDSLFKIVEYKATRSSGLQGLSDYTFTISQNTPTGYQVVGVVSFNSGSTQLAVIRTGFDTGSIYIQVHNTYNSAVSSFTVSCKVLYIRKNI